MAWEFINEFCLYNLNFTDDRMLFAQDAYDAEFMLKRLSINWRLTINICLKQNVSKF